MSEPIHILYISQEIHPYLQEETPMRIMGRKLPEFCQSHGCDTRTFMPKFGEINERRNQLHEVIRLSGTNIMISDMDHPTLIKVASIQSARVQVYFIDNDDYFKRRKGVTDEKGNWYPDNDERTIFYCRSVLETINRQRWTPDIIHVSGWMSALAPLYIKKAFNDAPFFAKAKVVFSVFDQKMNQTFGTKFADKLLIPGVTPEDVASLKGRKVTYNQLIKLAIDYSDGVIQSTPKISPTLTTHIKQSALPFLPYQENIEAYLDFYKHLLGK